MATGYTHCIEDDPGLTFRAFALRCARAFGACMSQRDEDMASPPRVDPPSDYSAQALRKAEAKLRELRATTPAQAEALYRSEVAAIAAKNEQYRAEHETKLARYAAMRAKVAAWQPPTVKHVSLKTFMLEQIDGSVDFAGAPYVATICPTAAEWIADQIDAAERAVEWRSKDVSKEAARHAERVAWIGKLYESLDAAEGGGK